MVEHALMEIEAIQEAAFNASRGPQTNEMEEIEEDEQPPGYGLV
jgi:hypothetical protein